MNLTTAEVTQLIRDTRISDLTQIAALAGVPETTLIKIKYGITKDPRSGTIDRLRTYFEHRAAA